MPCLLWPLIICWPLILLLPVRRASREQCGSCGYDLRGNESGRCPECGTPVGEGDAYETPAGRAVMFRWIAWAMGALVLACALHWSFRLTHGADLRAYYTSPFYGNNAPWDVGTRYYLWAIGGPLWLCVVSVILCIAGVVAGRMRGSKAFALPLIAWLVTAVLFFRLALTWAEWFVD